jgi:hypothetical protein
MNQRFGFVLKKQMDILTCNIGLVELLESSQTKDTRNADTINRLRR